MTNIGLISMFTLGPQHHFYSIENAMFLLEMSIFHLIDCSLEVMALTQEQVSRYIFILA